MLGVCTAKGLHLALLATDGHIIQTVHKLISTGTELTVCVGRLVKLPMQDNEPIRTFCMVHDPIDRIVKIFLTMLYNMCYHGDRIMSQGEKAWH